jgi:hypothetical protein
MAIAVEIKKYRGIPTDMSAYVKAYTIEVTPSKHHASVRLAIYASRDAYVDDADANVLAWDRIDVVGDEFDYYFGPLLASTEGQNIVGLVYAVVATKANGQSGIGLDYTKSQAVIDPGQVPVEITPYQPPAEMEAGEA